MSPTPIDEPNYIELKRRLQEIHDIQAASALLDWDQATYMPSGGAMARGRQIGTLKKIAHEKFTDPAIGQLLEALQPYETSLPYESIPASLIRVTRKDYHHARQIPPEFTERLSQHQAVTYGAWAQARSTGSFPTVQPYLEKTLELSQELAHYLTGWEHIADPLIDQYDEGMTVATVRKLFTPLRQQLIPMVAAIKAAPEINDTCLHQFYPEAEQLSFGQCVIFRLGYDFNRGRQDKTLHPFMTKFSLGDVRITTRVNEQDIGEALFSTIHEAGHAMYEQGINPELEGTPLANGVSAGVHESQSRLWENLVGRSRGFWEWFYPQLQGTFIRQLRQTSSHHFYRAINKVQPPLIRTEADEVTYNLHVMIRFDLELALLEGKLAVKDLPEAWNDRYKTDLGVVPQTDTEGVLQDVHWYFGTIGGMFQGYTLGNLMAAQFYQTAILQDPEIPFEIERGKFQRLYQWLQENIYYSGRQYTPNELIEQVTGEPLQVEALIQYIRQKYGYLYQIEL
jgi:carboxypeptidase Taq